MPGVWLMATKHMPIDHAERDLASAQLDELALAHDGVPWTAWKDAVLDWHLQRFATARAEAWIPGFAGSHDHDPVIKKLLSRFYRHHMHTAIHRLRAENIELRRKIVDAVECTRFYASGAIDAGERATTMLRSLLSPRATTSSATVDPAQSHRDGPSRSRPRDLPELDRFARP
jgi:hypothetical protein